MASTPRLLLALAIYSFYLGTPTSSDTPPDISINLSGDLIYIPEDTPIGTELFNITVTDVDGDAIDIAVDTNTGNVVSLNVTDQNGNERQATVMLTSRLDRDRENTPGKALLRFKVTAGTFELPRIVTMLITDVNDNPPFLTHLPYRLELHERTNRTNSTVFTVHASDPDSGPGGSVHFSMQADAQGADALYNETFVIRQASSGAIRLEQELDYEKRNYYQYKVFAEDVGTPPCPGPHCLCSNATEPNVVCEGIPAIFAVTVIDVQDTPPRFERLPYIATLPENTTVNMSVLTVSAIDGDRGVPNKVNYTIDCDNHCPFSMDAQSGLITIRDELNADVPGGRSYSLTVTATEIQAAGQEQYGETTATTKVSITVEDVNDNEPQFGASHYTATVQENTPRGVPITLITAINVTDMDQGKNSQFRLSVMREGQPYQAFTTLPSPYTDIQGSATIMISVNNSTVLDYEQQHNVTFQIQAKESNTDEEFYNLTTIFLSIIDMNDNSPRFEDNQSTDLNVTENSANGTHLTVFTATDADSGDFGTVAYSLEDDFDGKFAINKDTGNLTVEAPLDRDTGDERFSLVIVAQDNVVADENQRRSARLSVRLTVLDLNDNPPVFQTSLRHVAVQENAEIGTVLIGLKATDKDQGSNGEVHYRLLNIVDALTAVSSPPALFLFDINATTGEVFVNASLIGHPGLFNVTLMAWDGGQEPLNASTLVTVKVRDVNVNPPVFVHPDQSLYNATLSLVPNITILENEPNGTWIMQLTASDADTGKNGEVQFYLDPDLDSAFVLFSLDPVTGNLSNRVVLDCDEGRDVYQLSLRAQDKGQPISLSKVLPFKVLLKDVDDNDPHFTQTSPLVLSVQEMARDIIVGLVNISTDKDRDPENRLACYYLCGGEKLSYFEVNKTTGELRLMQKLNRTQTTEVTVKVKTTKNCSLPEKHFIPDTPINATALDDSELTVRVEVMDINNHPPVFNKDAMVVGLLYDVAVGSEFTNLASYTSDLDTPEHSQHMFRMLGFRGPNSGASTGPVNSTFVVFANGSVVTQRIFAPDEGGNFVLTVQAYDVDHLNDTADLTIYLVSNLKRVKLVFNQPPNQVNQIKADTVKRLGDALGMTVIADKIVTHIQLDGTADPQRTDVYIHARRIPSGEIVPTSELVNAFDYNQQVVAIFQEYGVSSVAALEVGDKNVIVDSEQKIFIIVILALAIVTVALGLVLFTSVRRYRRKLKAATTQSFVTTKDLPNSFVPPGTNKYMSENPIYGKDLKPDDFPRTEDREGDSDSLDDNEVNGGGSKRPGGQGSHEGEGEEDDEEQEMCLDMYDDDVGASRRQHVNQLAMVLKEYDTHNTQGVSQQSTAWESSSGMLGGPSSPHPKAPNGLSGGHTNNGFEEDLDNLQTTDI